MATKVDGGWLLNGKKIFASLSGAATYYGVLCTEDKPDRSVRDTCSWRFRLMRRAFPSSVPGTRSECGQRCREPSLSKMSLYRMSRCCCRGAFTIRPHGAGRTCS